MCRLVFLCQRQPVNNIVTTPTKHFFFFGRKHHDKCMIIIMESFESNNKFRLSFLIALDIFLVFTARLGIVDVAAQKCDKFYYRHTWWQKRRIQSNTASGGVFLVYLLEFNVWMIEGHRVAQFIPLFLFTRTYWGALHSDQPSECFIV